MVCTGSHLATRHLFRRGVNNRSVYCKGLMELPNAAHEEMLKYMESRPGSTLSPPLAVAASEGAGLKVRT